MEVSLQEILTAREQRANRQKQLLDTYQKPLLCFTMNIPGPVKMDRDISIGFHVGMWLLKDTLPSKLVLHKEHHMLPTGCEAYYVVDMPARELKKLAVDLEQTDSIGRLFDMDVLDADGNKLDRADLQLSRRTCLLCDEDAVLCARSRAHSLAELQDRTGFLLYLCARQWMTEYIATRAYFALSKEVSTTPKPGLVDGNNSGSHKDMDLRHFFASSNALRPYFCRFAETGFLTRDLSPEETLQKLRPIGMEAEAAMLKATRGVNTHKGAIFSLGLLCAAAGRLSPELWQPERLLAECGAMAQGIVSRELGNITEETAKTFGEKLFAAYGITGIRGQTEAGFPAVLQTGLPILQAGLKQGLSLNDAGACTLLHLLAVTDDTSLIHRCDRDTQLQIQKKLTSLLADTPYPSMETIKELDKEFIEKNLSPGGSADLLALTYFLHFLLQ